MKIYEEGTELLGGRGFIVVNLSKKLKKFFEENKDFYPPHYLALNAKEIGGFPPVFFLDFKSRTFREKYKDFSLEERQVAGYKFFRDLFGIPVFIFVKDRQSEEWLCADFSKLVSSGKPSVIEEDGAKAVYYFKSSVLQRFTRRR